MDITTFSEKVEPITDDKKDQLVVKSWRPNEGRSWSPLLNFPRNDKCFCGSGIKFKKCHLNKLARTCTKLDAEKINEIMKSKGLK